jgi:hypothetical protein
MQLMLSFALLSTGLRVKPSLGFENLLFNYDVFLTVCGETAALNALAKADANISTPDINGAYPIHYAVQMSAPLAESTSSQMTGLISQLPISRLFFLIDNHLKFLFLVLRHLINLGADVNVKDPDGRGPVMWAASAGQSKKSIIFVM